jgi:hypothetical protein
MLLIGAFAYLLALCTLGIVSLARGHWAMFLLGFVFPPLWLVGAVLPTTAAATKQPLGGAAAGLVAGARAEREMTRPREW